MVKYVYDFSEGDKSMKDLLGGKGANLAEMTKLGLPVPPGFTISTEACRVYLREGKAPETLDTEVTSHCATSKTLWDASSATLRTRSWSPSAPAPSSPCPA